jgi:RNA polymerase sigma factor (TIGR02999 family)
LIYDQLRKLATAKLAREKPGQTLQPTALVHDAYLRLVDVEQVQHWNSRNHFYAAAAEAMRRILVDNARRKASTKHGGELTRGEFDEMELASTKPDEVIAIHDALHDLADHDPLGAEMVKLHYFGGFPLEEAAGILGLSRATGYRTWTYARAWLRATMLDETSPVGANS